MRIKRKWIAGIIILFLYFCTYQESEGLKFLHGAKPLVRHTVNFGLLLTVAGFGVYGLSREKQKWVRTIWIAIYFMIIGFMGVLGIVDLLYYLDNLSFRNMVSFLRMFFTSPVPYGIVLFLLERSKIEAGKRL